MSGPAAAEQKIFRIAKCVLDGTVKYHGKWHPETEPKTRYIDLEHRSGIGSISGYVTPEAFTAIMRALVSASYDTPNWCEKCHLAGHGYCRCEIACNE